MCIANAVSSYIIFPHKSTTYETKKQSRVHITIIVADSTQVDALLKHEQLPASVKVEIPTVDYTPPAYISLLFTDLGVLTPSAVSDELIKLYY